jgi:membrane protease YdiL (CAAX protease family)
MNELREILMQDGGTTMYIVFLSILLILFAITVVSEFLETRKLPDAPLTEKEKCEGYFQSIGILWGAVLVVFIMCFVGGISLESIGFRQISFNYGFWFTAGTLTVSGLFFAYMVYNLIFLLKSAKYREKQIKEAGSSVVVKFLPKTKKEKWLFSFVALSAGVCEEIIFRGFLVFLFLAIFPDMPIYLVVLIPIVIFGVGHLYQGLQGVMQTALVGAIFMCLYLVTNSLILPMLLHFFVDLVATFLLSEEDTSLVVSD